MKEITESETATNKMYVTLRGEAEISSLGFKQRTVTWNSKKNPSTKAVNF